MIRQARSHAVLQGHHIQETRLRRDPAARAPPGRPALSHLLLRLRHPCAGRAKTRGPARDRAAITDHNQVGGVLEAARQKSPIPLIPGIEVSASDGPHLLLYFYAVSDLADFYSHHIEKNRRSGPFTAICLDTNSILDASEAYPCVTAEAHPCGYALLNRGVQRCVAGHRIDEEVFSRLDALEVICGGMARSHNLKAAELATAHNLGRTGGTDGHLLHELGGVVTCAEADTAEEFLEAVRKRETVIIGQERPIVEKAMMGTAVLPHHLPYTVPILRARWEQNLPQLRGSSGPG